MKVRYFLYISCIVQLFAVMGTLCAAARSSARTAPSRSLVARPAPSRDCFVTTFELSSSLEDRAREAEQQELFSVLYAEKVFPHMPRAIQEIIKSYLIPSSVPACFLSVPAPLGRQGNPYKVSLRGCIESKDEDIHVRLSECGTKIQFRLGADFRSYESLNNFLKQLHPEGYRISRLTVNKDRGLLHVGFLNGSSIVIKIRWKTMELVSMRTLYTKDANVTTITYAQIVPMERTCYVVEERLQQNIAPGQLARYICHVWDLNSDTTVLMPSEDFAAYVEPITIAGKKPQQMRMRSIRYQTEFIKNNLSLLQILYLLEPVESPSLALPLKYGAQEILREESLLKDRTGEEVEVVRSFPGWLQRYYMQYKYGCVRPVAPCLFH